MFYFVMFYVFNFVFSFLLIYTPMEVVCPVGMFVYTAVYKLAADGAVFDTHEKKSMVQSAPKRKPRYLISRFMFSFLCFPFCLSTRPWRLCALLVCLFIRAKRVSN